MSAPIKSLKIWRMDMCQNVFVWMRSKIIADVQKGHHASSFKVKQSGMNTSFLQCTYLRIIFIYS
jgi:hypothetical protein